MDLELSPQQKFIKSVMIVARAHQTIMARDMERYHIGAGQYPTLQYVCGAPGISQDQLAHTMRLNKSSVARSIAQLEENGYLTRTPRPGDKRAYRLMPTQKALALMPELNRLVDAGVDELLQELDREEFMRLSESMERVAAKIKKSNGHGQMSGGKQADD